MKTFYLFSTFLLISFFACTHNSSSDSSNSASIDSLALATVTLHVEGMTCEGCEMTVSSTLEKLEGVQQASASHVDSTTLVIFDTTKVTLAIISEKISEVGYSVIGETERN